MKPLLLVAPLNGNRIFTEPHIFPTPRLRAKQSYRLAPPFSLAELKKRLTHWAGQHPCCLVLDSCEDAIDRYGSYELLIGVGQARDQIKDWDSLQSQQGDWLMGGFPYDLKNRFEPSLPPAQEAEVAFPEVAFFKPETVIALRKGEQELSIEGPALHLDRFLDPGYTLPLIIPGKSPSFQSNFSRQAYLDTVRKLQNHIVEGDCYEINLSQVYSAEFFLENPAEVFMRLRDLSPVPFAAFFKFGDRYILSASPERFLQHQSGRLLTQPIKGTASRESDAESDLLKKKALLASEKERAENIMIVDLSRNDLYRSSQTNSVEVPHLFEIQTFPQVHQMVSTVTGQKRPELSPCDVLANTFPAGSMTGAPKVRTIKLIEQYEQCSRGLYAGSLGYFSPNGDFDFNVVIRSLAYDARQHKLSYHVGGAITYDSDPAAEYEETLVKAKAIRELFA